MNIGPVEILVVAFPGNQFTGEIAPALGELVETGQIRVIDLVFVAKDAGGDIVGIELSDIDESNSQTSMSRSARHSVRTSRNRAGSSLTRTSRTWVPTFRRTRRPRSCCSNTCGPQSSAMRS